MSVLVDPIVNAGTTAHHPDFSLVDTLILNAELMRKNSALEAEDNEADVRGMFLYRVYCAAYTRF